jgi:hypothetical protein
MASNPSLVPILRELETFHTFIIYFFWNSFNNIFQNFSREIFLPNTFLFLTSRNLATCPVKLAIFDVFVCLFCLTYESG